MRKDLQIELEVFNLANRRDSAIDYLYASRMKDESAPRNDIHFHPIEPRSARLTLIKNLVGAASGPRLHRAQCKNATLSGMTTSRPALYRSVPRLPTPCARDGYALLRPADVAALAGCSLDRTRRARPELGPPAARQLPEGRRPLPAPAPLVLRRRGRARSSQAPHRAHWQPVEYNALHGGMRALVRADRRRPSSRSRPGAQLLRALARVLLAR